MPEKHCRYTKEERALPRIRTHRASGRQMEGTKMTFGELIMFTVRLLAGTGVFLVGVHLLTANIEQLATGKIKDLFEKT